MFFKKNYIINCFFSLITSYVYGSSEISQKEENLSESFEFENKSYFHWLPFEMASEIVDMVGRTDSSAEPNQSYFFSDYDDRGFEKIKRLHILWGLHWNDDASPYYGPLDQSLIPKDAYPTWIGLQNRTKFPLTRHGTEEFFALVMAYNLMLPTYPIILTSEAIIAKTDQEFIKGLIASLKQFPRQLSLDITSEYTKQDLELESNFLSNLFSTLKKEKIPLKKVSIRQDIFSQDMISLSDYISDNFLQELFLSGDQNFYSFEESLYGHGSYKIYSQLRKNFHENVLKKNLKRKRTFISTIEGFPGVFDRDVKNLMFSLEKGTHLESLSLTKIFLSDIGCLDLTHRLQHNRSLKHLDLSANFLTDDSMEGIRMLLIENKSLKSLTLDQNFFTDAGLKMLIDGMMQNQTLEKLSLSINYLTQDGLSFLFQHMKDHKTLKSLKLNAPNEEFKYRYAYLNSGSEILSQSIFDLLSINDSLKEISLPIDFMDYFDAIYDGLKLNQTLRSFSIEGDLCLNRPYSSSLGGENKKMMRHIVKKINDLKSEKPDLKLEGYLINILKNHDDGRYDVSLNDTIISDVGFDLGLEETFDLI